MSVNETILIVEDEKLIRMTLRERLQREGYRIVEAETAQAAVTRLDDEGADLILLDYRLPDTNGIEVLRHARENNPATNVILMTADSSVDSAVEALRLGAYDYLRKPVNHDELVATIGKSLETTRLRREVKRLRDEQKNRYGFRNIVGRSEPMQEVLLLLQKIAASAATTALIEGESGTGKDLAAKAVRPRQPARTTEVSP